MWASKIFSWIREMQRTLNHLRTTRISKVIAKKGNPPIWSEWGGLLHSSQFGTDKQHRKSSDFVDSRVLTRGLYIYIRLFAGDNYFVQLFRRFFKLRENSQNTQDDNSIGISTVSPKQVAYFYFCSL